MDKRLKSCGVKILIAKFTSFLLAKSVWAGLGILIFGEEIRFIPFLAPNGFEADLVYFDRISR